MSRRTKKRKDGWYDINLVIDENVDEELKPLVIGEYVRHSLNKLGQLEDIEEELGIDLTTLFKALTQGIWAWENVFRGDDVERKLYKIDKVYIQKDGFGCEGWFIVNGYKAPTWWKLKDYGKTWALTKEELL